jgi:hypothetical protein
MFGFPFITSLIIVVAGVIGLSLIINKGLAKRRQEADASLTTPINTPQSSH